MEQIIFWIANNPVAALLAACVIFLVATFAGGLAWFRMRARSFAENQTIIEQQRLTIESAAKELAGADAQLRNLTQIQQELQETRLENARLSKRIAAQDATMDEREKNITRQHLQMKEQFQALSADVLKSAQTQFLEVAQEKLSKHQQAADNDLKVRQEAITNLLKPVEETLKRYEKNLGEIERSRQEAYGALTSELKQVAIAQLAVKDEAGKLVNALRAAPKTRGRWGEHQLRNVLELSGMTEHVDFQTEVSFDVENGKQRPDAIIRMPGGRTIAVDVKTSFPAFMSAYEAVDETVRKQHLALHARHIRDHVKSLASKKYWEALKETPDFVVMFVPGENFFSAAFESDSDLFEDAISLGVIIASPSSMVAIAKSIAYGWRQESMAENARHVSDLGRDLYRRLTTMGTHVAAMGRGLDGAVKKYNEMVGSLERNVLPQARKFQDLKVEGTGDAIAEINPIESETRELIRGKDLEFKPE